MGLYWPAERKKKRCWLQVSDDRQRVTGCTAFGELAVIFVARRDTVAAIVSPFDLDHMTRLRTADRKLLIFAHHSVKQVSLNLTSHHI